MNYWLCLANGKQPIFFFIKLMNLIASPPLPTHTHTHNLALENYPKFFGLYMKIYSIYYTQKHIYN